MGISLSFSGWTGRLTALELRMKTESYARELPRKNFALRPVAIKNHRQDGKKSPILSRGRREELAVSSVAASGFCATK